MTTFGTSCGSWLARVTAAILMFELVCGLTITFGPFHPAVEWSLLLHTAAGLITLAPLTWYFVLRAPLERLFQTSNIRCAVARLWGISTK